MIEENRMRTIVRPRQSVVTVAALAVAASLAGCSTAAPVSAESSAPSADPAWPVTIAHAFGETVIDEQPERVVALGVGSLDAAISLGVVPVAVGYRAVENGTDGLPPWTVAALDEAGAEHPTVLPDTGEDLAFEEIAAADPDVILAQYSGMTEEQYDTLSDIAPVVAYPGEPWATPWRDIVTITGQALGYEPEARALLDEIDADLAARAAENPEFAGRTVAFVWDTAGTFYVWNENDPRVEVLLDLGFVNAPAVDALDTGETSFSFSLSYETVSQLESDVLVVRGNQPGEVEQFIATPHAGTMAQVQAGAIAKVVGSDVAASMTPPTPLSYDYALDELIAELQAAVAALD
jgi:iron complex transport system substrate-binding protein